MKKITLLIFFSIFHIWMYVAAQYTRLSNLPAIYIDTYGMEEVVSKETYLYATMWYVDEKDNITRYDSLQIRGRGNSTWGWNKKPYRIKFHEKTHFLGSERAKAKSWVLLANAGDKTMMRNAITSAMGEFLGMPFNPAYKYADFTLNGKFLGCYQISDQIDVRKKRVHIQEQDYPLTDTSNITGGYLLEADFFKDGNFFQTPNGIPVRIHYPDDEEIAPEQNNYINNFVCNFEEKLYGKDFTDSLKGYRPYVDSVSLANWYIATEVSANVDGFWSLYFYKKADDDKLYWGPLWDYDIAYDNDNRTVGTHEWLMAETAHRISNAWAVKMWEDPWFGTLIIRRYREVLDSGLVGHMIQTIDDLAELLQESQELNYEVWGIDRQLGREHILYSSYDQYLVDLRNFIHTHTAYLTAAFTRKAGSTVIPQPNPKPEPEPNQGPFIPEPYYYNLHSAKCGKAIDYNEKGICIWNTEEARRSADWQITRVGEYYHFINRENNMALNDPTQGEVGATVNTGATLNLALPDTLDARQLWTLTPQSNKFFNLTNKHTDHTANLSGGKTEDGSSIVSYTNEPDRNATSQNRQWIIVKSDRMPDESTETHIKQIEPREYVLAYNSDTQTLHFRSATPDLLTFTANVYSADGKLVATFYADQEQSVAGLPNGTYIVGWRCGGKNRSARFIK